MPNLGSMAIWLKIFYFPNAAMTRRWWMLCLLGITLLLTSQLGFAQSSFNQCLNMCFNTCDSGPADLAWGCRENCGNSCQSKNHNQNTPAPYGSIAIGAHGFEGISWNKGTAAAADQSAIATCNRYGSNCKVVYRYQNTCAALAFSKGAQHYESATGNSEKQAEANATALCKKHWGYCLSDISACSLVR